MIKMYIVERSVCS